MTVTSTCLGKPLLTVENLAMDYDDSSGKLPVLEGLSFHVREGEFLCLVGPSGYGKTTLLRLLAGLETPRSGCVCLAGERVFHPRRDVGVVFQQPTLMDWRTVQDNVALPLQLDGISKDLARRQAQDLIDLIGLSGFEDYHPAQLSGGMAQRVALARALVHDPQVLLLDEPFGALDALTREGLWQELLRIWGTNRKTVVMVTHSVSEAIFLADRVLVLGARPAAVVGEVIVDLARPRNRETFALPEFGDLTRRVREALDRAGRPASQGPTHSLCEQNGPLRRPKPGS
jgi:NitT/TauT family transport system ATP-binding protein